jgi:hypothetical protein
MRRFNGKAWLKFEDENGLWGIATVSFEPKLAVCQVPLLHTCHDDCGAAAQYSWHVLSSDTAAL